MGFKEKIDSICEDVNISRTKLSKMLGTTQSSFNNSVNNGKFRQSRLTAIAEKLGAQYYAYFIFDGGDRFEIAGTDSILETVQTICNQYGLKFLDIAKALGYKNSYNFAARLTTGLFSQEELENIAEALGCKYECGFIVQDNSSQIAEVNYKAAIESESEKVLTEAEIEHLEQERLRKNARQRAYLKKTGYTVNAKYNKKTYTQIMIREKKEVAEAYKNKCKELGISYSEPLHEAIENFLKN